MDYADYVDSVADRLETHGWQKGSLGGKDGPNCIAGAARVIPEADLFRFMRLSRDITAKTGAWAVAVFNDREGTTEQEVLDTLRLIAKEARL